MAEWSKALDLGSSLCLRGFKSHRCQFYAGLCFIHLPCCILFSRPLLRGQFKTQTKVNLRYLHLTRQTNTYTYQGWHTHTHKPILFIFQDHTRYQHTHFYSVFASWISYSFHSSHSDLYGQTIIHLLPVCKWYFANITIIRKSHGTVTYALRIPLQIIVD